MGFGSFLIKKKCLKKLNQEIMEAYQVLPVSLKATAQFINTDKLQK